MEYKEIINKIKPELDKVIGFLERELAKIRTSRPTSTLVEDLMIDYYGEKTPLKQLSLISVTGPRTLCIQPWDKSILLNIERAILESNLGINPIVEKDKILLSLPPLSEEYRKNLLRLLNEKLEVARSVLRRWREEAWRQIQEGFRQGKIREDDKFRAKDELQELIDEYNGKIDEMGERKKKEIME